VLAANRQMRAIPDPKRDVKEGDLAEVSRGRAGIGALPDEAVCRN
jgi:hypothetical protein